MVRIYRESQISFEKSNFSLHHPNNPMIFLFQEIIPRNPQAFYIWRNLQKFEDLQKNTIY